jgi:hypothetical protein
MFSSYRIILAILVFTSCKTNTPDSGEQINKIPKSALIDSLRSFVFYDPNIDSSKYEFYDDNPDSRQLLFFDAFSKKYSEKELIELTDHPSPIIRCYSFKALVNQSSPQIFNLLVRHLRDTTYFLRFVACLSDDGYVTDHYLEQVGYAGLRQHTSNFQLTEEESKIVDSIVLFGDEIKKRSHLGSIKYYTRRYALKRLNPEPRFHDRIREIAIAGVNEALPLLAKYKDPADTAIFINLLRNDEFSNAGRNRTIYVREAIRYFPHPSFYPVLKDLLMAEVGTNAISDEYESLPLYKALVQYPTRETRELLEKALKMSKDEYHTRSRYIYLALKEKPSKIFDGLTNYAPQKLEQ